MAANKKLSEEYSSELGATSRRRNVERATMKTADSTEKLPVAQLQKRAEASERDPSSWEEYYQSEALKAAREENYKLLLNNQMSLYNLKRNSEKNLANELAAQGLGTQGYGTSANVGLSNEYMRQLSEARSDYDEEERDLNLQEAQYEAEREEQDKAEAEQDAIETDNQLYQFLSAAGGDEEKINRYMQIYGYGKDEAKGKWYKTNEDGSLNYDQPASSYLEAAIYGATNGSTSTGEYDAKYALENWAANYGGFKNQTDGWQQSTASSNNSGFTFDELSNMKVNYHDNEYGPDKDDKGKERDLEWLIGNELDKMESLCSSGAVENGTLFKLTRKSDKKEAYLVLWYNGKYYLVSDNDDEQAGGQVDVKYQQFTGPKYEF